jgi:hypothetical protein
VKRATRILVYLNLLQLTMKKLILLSLVLLASSFNLVLANDTYIGTVVANERINKNSHGTLRVKLLSATYGPDFEKLVNKWLSENPDAFIVSITYQDPKYANPSNYSVMIVYRVE